MNNDLNTKLTCTEVLNSLSEELGANKQEILQALMSYVLIEELRSQIAYNREKDGE